ncbi:MAG: M23 family metallopeptidase [bacterium]
MKKKQITIISLFIAAFLIVFGSLTLIAIPTGSFNGNIVLSTQEAYPGETLRVIITGAKQNADFCIKFNSKSYEFYPTKDSSYRALIPLPVSIDPGGYVLALEYKNFILKKSDLVGEVNIKESKYKSEKINFSKSKKKLFNETINGKGPDKGRVLLEQAYKTKSAQQLWDGRFMKPTKGRITSQFGTSRVYDLGKKIQSYHKGIDLSAAKGTKVYAANDGKVVLAHYLALSGFVVAIDHGQEVISLYKHLSKINVEEGKKVLKGEVVGLSGEAGLSTGPHLHWELRVHGVPVEPFSWLSNEF